MDRFYNCGIELSCFLFFSGGVAAGRKLPKELDRNQVVLVDTLGKGEFGEV